MDTPERVGAEYVIPVKANTKIFFGTLVVLDGGFAAPGRTALNLIVMGRAEETVDNTGGAAGDKSIKVRRGVFKFNQDPGAVSTQANVGTDAFITDDQTIARTNGTNTKSRAGRIMQIDADGVWIDTRY
ncbi:MAG: hypothetical protein HC933_05565 [Pleurocapsa sp. SU_196_0]|nr:hypothetical protein [Pleurocapsa sp. SU_196_0]